MKVHRIQGIRLYADDLYMDNIRRRRIVLSKKQTETVKSLANGTVLDIGANIGHLTIPMAKLADRVIAFEPEPENFNILEMNINLHKLNNVVPINCAIADGNGIADLNICKFNNGMHRLYPSKWCEGGKVKVITRRIDDMIQEDVDFIKMDIEGAELGALMGMRKLLARAHPTIMLEFHPPSIRECGDNPRDIYDLLVDMGYSRFKLIDDYKPNIDNISYEELEELTSEQAAKNLICV